MFIIMATESLSDIVKPLQHWCQQSPVNLCVLFGSQATGRARPGSDVDIALWPIEEPSPQLKLCWLGQLQSRLNKEVSLVFVLPGLDPVLGIEIYRHGQLVYQAKPELWFHHRLQLWHRYNDSLPFLRLARQRLRQFAKEVKHGS